MSIRIINADMREALRDLAAQGVKFHSCVTDPPYHLTSIVKRFGKAGSALSQFGTDGAYARASRGFMGKEWDGGDIAFQPETWRAVYDVLLPGAHLLAFSGTRTYHRMACAIEDAGFEIRDQAAWMYGSGFPKSHDVSKGIDKAAGAERQVIGTRAKHHDGAMRTGGGDFRLHGGGVRDIGDNVPVTTPATPEAAQWAGWGTALKPSWEPVLFGSKPLTVTQHFGIVIDAITNLLARNCEWSGLNAKGAEQSFSAIQAKSQEAANSVLEHARTRSLVSIGIAPYAEAHSTSNAPEWFDALKTKDCFALSHVGQSTRRGDNLERTTQHGLADGILIRLMDMSMSVMAEGISGSIVSSWRGISGELLTAGNTFTTETASRLTTGLRTLSWSMQQLTSISTGNLSPNWEPCIVARKPLIGSVAANVLAHGTGALNIDACRVEAGEDHKANCTRQNVKGIWGNTEGATVEASPLGRWPANVIHDGSAEVEEAFAAFGERKSPGTYTRSSRAEGEWLHAKEAGTTQVGFGDSGSASRFFYSAKADKTDRAGSKHPTVKPTDLMRYLVQLVTPPGGTVLDPFAGSGSTGLAADQLGMNAVLIERDPEYAADIERKISSDAPLFADVVTA